MRALLAILFLGVASMMTAQEPKKDEPKAKYDKVVTLVRDGEYAFEKSDIPAYFRESDKVKRWYLKPGPGKYTPKKGYTIIDPDGWKWRIDEANNSNDDVCDCTKMEKVAPKKP